jgi:hypothetical protein
MDVRRGRSKGQQASDVGLLRSIRDSVRPGNCASGPKRAAAWGRPNLTSSLRRRTSPGPLQSRHRRCDVAIVFRSGNIVALLCASSLFSPSLFSRSKTLGGALPDLAITVETRASSVAPEPGSSSDDYVARSPPPRLAATGPSPTSR